MSKRSSGASTMRRLSATSLILLVAGACGTDPPPTDGVRAACEPGAQLLQVAQGPMNPTLQAGDVAAIVPLGLLGPNRGDIVAIDWPTWTGDDGPDAPMRVIGAAGDHIELRAGKVVLNGSELAEPYLEAGVTTNPAPDRPADWIVPDGSVFVLGDGREHAADSRFYGAAPDGSLLGRVVFRCGPAGRRGPVS